MTAMGRRRSPRRCLLPLAAGLSCILLQSDLAFGADDGEDSAIGFLVISGLVIAAIYIIPTIIAFVRTHPNRWLIALINITFGGTVIG